MSVRSLLSPVPPSEEECGCPRRLALPRERATRAEAEAAVRTLISWAGDDPAREGLLETPTRVVRAYEEWFSGYARQPAEILKRTFGETAGYDDLVLLRDIPLESVCEHHMAAIRGVAHIAYLPRERVVGISKLARLVDAFAHRLQIQERLTAEIADAIEAELEPRGVAVVLEASHDCMSSRGVRKHGSALVTRAFRGLYSDPAARREVLDALKP
ncbi:GTP cyclohydrolase I FolE [Bosea sp. (in: a-proteobacteria)]|uniref:GTP cyclohydrolase I FolE n=1 Tax=Bosea sp. (in: a-proteobacteria) TaxID=1871050 RepID=UPI002FC6955E